MNFPRIYLASQSPRRRELLQQIGVDFEVLTVEVDESVLANESAAEYVQRLAIEKAQAGWSLLDDSYRPVLGADTSVIINDSVMGKPADQTQARQMLENLSGNSHCVLSAVALRSECGVRCLLSTSSVRFATLSNKDIDWYMASREGRDKAGSYAVQGLAALFIEQISGSYSGIMGLPLRETGLLLQQMKATSE